MEIEPTTVVFTVASCATAPRRSMLEALRVLLTELQIKNIYFLYIGIELATSCTSIASTADSCKKNFLKFFMYAIVGLI